MYCNTCEIKKDKKKKYCSYCKNSLSEESFLPENKSLPFFTYGVFRPGDIPFLGIKEYVSNIIKLTIKGNILVRDGVFLFEDGENDIEGYLIYFDAGELQDSAYNFISELEPSKLFEWEQREVDEVGEFNILYGKKPKSGSEEINYVKADMPNYSTIQDPYFVAGLELFEDLQIGNPSSDFRSSFKLQMYYPFLWTIIERFSFLRYGLGLTPTKRTNKLAENIFFIKAIEKFVPDSTKENPSRKIFRSDSPKSKAAELDKTSPLKCIKYYYQVRNNLTHRGKGRFSDQDILGKSLSELKQIIKYVLIETIKECENIRDNYCND